LVACSDEFRTNILYNVQDAIDVNLGGDRSVTEELGMHLIEGRNEAGDDGVVVLDETLPHCFDLEGN
jgi:hypothetical protein